MEFQDRPIYRAWEEFTPPLKDVTSDHSSHVRRDIRIGIVLKEEDQVKVNHLTSTVTASRSSRKSTYGTWMRFFYEGDGIRLDFVVEAFLATACRGTC